MAHAVTGQFNVIAYAKFVNMEMFRGITVELQSLRGVQCTQTTIAIPSIDWNNHGLSSMRKQPKHNFTHVS